MATAILEQKILELDELAKLTAQARTEGRRVVHCHGVFDLLHPGHVHHFEEAQSQGDILIVTVTQDQHVNKGPGRPIFNERLRLDSVAAMAAVDYVALNRWPSAVEAIQLLKPDVFVKGSEFSDRSTDMTGNVSEEEQAVCEIGGSLHLTDGITFSSSHLLNSYFCALPDTTTRYLRDFREKYSAIDIIQKLKQLNSMRVAVVGDAIIDEYHFCKPMGQASKSTAINARFLSSEVHAGGAMAVANHVAGFARHVHLVSCLGQQNTMQDEISARLKSNVSTKFFIRPDAPTTVKRRFTAEFLYNKLFEVTFLDDRPLDAELEHIVADYVNEVLPDYDLVLVTDFGHGFVGQKIMDVLARQPRFLAVNAQTNSANAGYNLVTKYTRADYVAIDEQELRLACHDRFGDVDQLAPRIAEQLKTSLFAVTQGHHGSTVFPSSGPPQSSPVLSTQVVDTTGAGDAYLSISTMCAAAGYSPDLVAFVGNCAGATAVRELGNRTSVDSVALFRFITALLK